MTASEYTELVHAVGKEAVALIFERTKNIEPKMRWLVIGRIVSGVFQRHFQPTFQMADEALIKSHAALARTEEDPKQ